MAADYIIPRGDGHAEQPWASATCPSPFSGMGRSYENGDGPVLRFWSSGYPLLYASNFGFQKDSLGNVARRCPTVLAAVATEAVESSYVGASSYRINHAWKTRKWARLYGLSMDGK